MRPGPASSWACARDPSRRGLTSAAPVLTSRTNARAGSGPEPRRFVGSTEPPWPRAAIVACAARAAGPNSAAKIDALPRSHSAARPTSALSVTRACRTTASGNARISMASSCVGVGPKPRASLPARSILAGTAAAGPVRRASASASISRQTVPPASPGAAGSTTSLTPRDAAALAAARDRSVAPAAMAVPSAACACSNAACRSNRNRAAGWTRTAEARRSAPTAAVGRLGETPLDRRAADAHGVRSRQLEQRIQRSLAPGSSCAPRSAPGFRSDRVESSPRRRCSA